MKKIKYHITWREKRQFWANCTCGWPLGLNTSDTHEMKKAKRCWEFVWACPHAWLSLTTGNTSCFSSITLWPRAAVFPMADSDTDSVRCRTTATESQIQALQPIPDIYTSVRVSHCVCRHAKGAWVCRDTSFGSKAPIRAQSWWQTQ